MPHRTCTIDGCERPHQARGMCGSHYGTWYKRTHAGAYRRSYESEKVERTCILCGTTWRTKRREAKFCSDACKGRHYSATMRRKSPLPYEHPVMVLIATAKADAKAAAELRRQERQRSSFAWRTERECPGCACWFTPLYTPNAVCCSQRCARRVHRWRRNASERNAMGTFTWSQFMQIARRFDYCCAYCGDKPGRLDPDHVVPLSRGGHNSTTNLLPACRSCNGDKRDLLLHEWEADREQRGKPPRVTSWAAGDRRYWHLTQVTTLPAAA